MQYVLDTNNRGDLVRRFLGQGGFWWSLCTQDDLYELNLTLNATASDRPPVAVKVHSETLLERRQFLSTFVSELHIPTRALLHRGVDWFRDRVAESTKIFAHLQDGVDRQHLLGLGRIDGYSLWEQMISCARGEVLRSCLSTGLPVHIHTPYPEEVYRLAVNEGRNIRSISSSAPVRYGLHGLAFHPEIMYYPGTIYNEDLPEYSHYTGITNWNIRVFEGWCRGVQIPPAPFL